FAAESLQPLAEVPVLPTDARDIVHLHGASGLGLTNGGHLPRASAPDEFRPAVLTSITGRHAGLGTGKSPNVATRGGPSGCRLVSHALGILCMHRPRQASSAAGSGRGDPKAGIGLGRALEESGHSDNKYLGASAGIRNFDVAGHLAAQQAID